MATQTMRVAMYYNNHDVRIEEMPVPQIGPRELLIKIFASGICGSDVLEWYRLKKAPLVLGHEIGGEIVAVGSEVKQYHRGQRVFVSHHVPCDTCRYCRAGAHTVCETLHTTNFDPGGFSEFVRVPELNVSRGVFPLPAELSYEDATFIEPLACVLRGQRLAGLKESQTVLIIGSGISGLLHVLTARAAGVKTLLAVDVNDYRLEAARRFGADRVFRANEDIPANVRQANGGRLADIVIVCTGALSAFRQALESVDRAGTVLFFACPEPGVELPVPVNKFWRNGVTLIPSYGNSPQDADEAIEMIRSGRVAVRPLITHRFGLERTAEGFRIVAEARDSIKVIIEPQRR